MNRSIGVSPPAPAGGEKAPRLAVLGALALGELVAAAGIGWLLWKLADQSAATSGHHDAMDHSAMDSAMSGAGGDMMGNSVMAHGSFMAHGLVVSLAFLAASILGYALVRCWPHQRSARRAAVVIGLASGVGVIYLSVVDGSYGSHLALMAALMTLTTAAPAAIAVASGDVVMRHLAQRASMTALAEPARGARPLTAVPIGVFRVGVTASAVSIALVIVAWHVPTIHGELTENTALATLLLVVAFTAGCTFWVLSTDAREATRAIRHRAVLIAGAPSGLLGLALILAPGPLMNHQMTEGLSSMTDQRLGGLLMMVVDLLFLVPLFLATTPAHSSIDIDGK